MLGFWNWHTYPALVFVLQLTCGGGGLAGLALGGAGLGGGLDFFGGSEGLLVAFGGRVGVGDSGLEESPPSFSNGDNCLKIKFILN